MSLRTRAIVGSTLFLLVAPGTVSGLIPWLITRWRVPEWGAVIWLVAPISAALILTGGGFLIHAFGRFALDGLGTPSPLHPTERLVATGVYRWVRNPMYLSIQSVILGQALFFSEVRLVVYATVTMLGMVSFVHWYEEPLLLRRFGSEYRTYLESVPGWWPRRPRPATDLL